MKSGQCLLEVYKKVVASTLIFGGMAIIKRELGVNYFSFSSGG